MEIYRGFLWIMMRGRRLRVKRRRGHRLSGMRIKLMRVRIKIMIITALRGIRGGIKRCMRNWMRIAPQMTRIIATVVNQKRRLKIKTETMNKIKS